MINDNPCTSEQLLRTTIAARDVLEQLRIEDRAKIKQLESLCRKLAEACKYSLNLELYRVGQHTHAIALFEVALEAAKKAGNIT